MKTLLINIVCTCGHRQKREVPDAPYTRATQACPRMSPMPCANCLRAQGHKMTDEQRTIYDRLMPKETAR